MRNIISYMAILFVCLSYTSCKEDLVVWDSQTLEYSGRYIVSLLDEDLNATGYDGYEIQLYSTADNIKNQLYIDDLNQLLPLKSKFTFTGSSDLFNSANLEFDQLSNNLNAVNVPKVAPTAVNQNKTEERDYLRSAVIEGKIIPQAATTGGGNSSDSIYIKIILYCGTATFKSYSLPVQLRADPEVEQFAWKLDFVTYDPELDETYVLSGYRFTGLPEDQL